MIGVLADTSQTQLKERNGSRLVISPSHLVIVVNAEWFSLQHVQMLTRAQPTGNQEIRQGQQ